MCGIAGIIGVADERHQAALRRMTDAMPWRGPDAQGHWISPARAGGQQVLFGHRRLAILDLSPLGVQPMVLPETGDCVVLNGEIYNYEQLRAELADRPTVLQSTGDTAVLLRLLAQRPDQALPRLRGMFAFAYRDNATGHVLLARDPLGIKPLYFARNPRSGEGWSLMFASEVRAILASGLLPEHRLDPRAVASVLWNGFTVAPHTAVVGVESLLPGEAAWFDGEGQLIRRFSYWSCPRDADGPPATQEELESALLESVRAHLISDVPVGVFLSGGIDSSCVANLAARAGSATINTFTLAFTEAERNEGDIARQVAQAIGTRHTEVVLTEQDFLGRLEPALDSLDQPSFDGLNSYFMSRAVRDAGFTVALVGSGGDELFGGYTSFRDLPAMQRINRWLGLMPRAARGLVARAMTGLLVGTGQGFEPQTRWAKLPDMVAAGSSISALYQLAYALYLPASQKRLLANPGEDAGLVDGLPDERRRMLLAELEGRSTLGAIGVLEQRLFLGERLLRDTDAASMAASIETRLPLVDAQLLSVVNRLGDHDRFQPVRLKGMLRRAGLKGLDPQLFDRPKSGFELPFDRWLRNALGQEIEATMLDAGSVAAAGLNPAEVRRLWLAFRAGAKGLYWTRIWAIFALIRWTQVNQVRY
ncbi:MAG: asparagine synthase (glutamine-hydrolyzing) [Burkholderiaceae bacterium]